MCIRPLLPYPLTKLQMPEEEEDFDQIRGSHLVQIHEYSPLCLAQENVPLPWAFSHLPANACDPSLWTSKLNNLSEVPEESEKDGENTKLRLKVKVSSGACPSG